MFIISTGIVTLFTLVSSSRLWSAVRRLLLGTASTWTSSKAGKLAGDKSAVPAWSHRRVVSMVHQNIAIQACIAQIPSASIEIAVPPVWVVSSVRSGLIFGQLDKRIVWQTFGGTVNDATFRRGSERFSATFLAFATSVLAFLFRHGLGGKDRSTLSYNIGRRASRGWLRWRVVFALSLLACQIAGWGPSIRRWERLHDGRLRGRAQAEKERERER